MKTLKLNWFLFFKLLSTKKIVVSQQRLQSLDARTRTPAQWLATTWGRWLLKRHFKVNPPPPHINTSPPSPFNFPTPFYYPPMIKDKRISYI